MSDISQNDTTEPQEDRRAKWQRENPDKVKSYRKKYWAENKEKLGEVGRQYKKKNRKEMRASHKKWCDNNIEKVRQYRRDDYHKNKDNPEWRLIHYLRSRINKALKKPRSVSIIKSIGCSPAELVEYLQERFQEGMTWDNHSVHGWHVDHIKPLALFDLSNPDELKKANHYTNLQPMWGSENCSKRKTWKDPNQVD